MADELILIIEDNEKNRKLVRDVLQVKGYKTIETETAEEGLKLALQQSPALILMDIQLPGMDGITALKQLRADPKTNGIAAIAITASAMTHNNVKLLADLLTVKGYGVLTAASGREALAQVEAERPDLVLLDVVMPEMSVYEVCRKIRESPATEILPVVMVTALDPAEERIK